MKDQYFGDINDFRKYGLLRLLCVSDRLRLGVCWILTDTDSRTDGKLLNYLHQPKKYRHRDPELFDWLLFESGILADHKDQRSAYFSKCATCFAGCDLVFFDPDNGLEIKSTQLGHK